MVQFFETVSGGTIPVSRIWSIYPDTSERAKDASIPVYNIRLDNADGLIVSVYYYEVARITTGRYQHIAAQPDTYLLGTVFGDCENAAEVSQWPIIAWAFDSDGASRPVTPHDTAGDSEQYAVLMPNGSVVGSGGDLWRTLGQWFADKKEELEQSH